MKKVKSLDDVRRLALATGARAEIGGEVFNAAQMRVDMLAPKPAAPAPVATIPPPVPEFGAQQLSRDEAMRLIAQRDEFWQAEIHRVTQSLAQSIASLAAAGPQRSFPHGARFTVDYGRGGEIRHIDAMPLPAPTAH